MRAQLLSHVQFFATPWTAAHQAPLSMGFFQARIMEWISISTSGDLPNQGSPVSPVLQAGSLPTELLGRLCYTGSIVHTWRYELSYVHSLLIHMLKP